MRSREIRRGREENHWIPRQPEFRRFILKNEIAKRLLLGNSIAKGNAVVVGSQFKVPENAGAGFQLEACFRADVADLTAFPPGQNERLVPPVFFESAETRAFVQGALFRQDELYRRGLNKRLFRAQNRECQAVSGSRNFKDDRVFPVGRPDAHRPPSPISSPRAADERR
jgi:hypothetical protein